MSQESIQVVPHSRPSITDADIAAVSATLSQCRLTDNSEVSLFEKEMSLYIGHDNGTAVNSGTNALYLALLSLEKGNKNEVIVPSYVCIALLNAVYLAGLEPKVVDIEEYSYNISISEIKKAINKNTVAIIAPHMFGDPIKSICEIVDLGVPVIEDCALSVGADIGTKKVGSFAEISVFSFYATKVLTTGHGGMILTSSVRTNDKLRDFMRYDNRQDYAVGCNFRLTDFQAALGRSQLRRLDEFVLKRRSIAEKYNKIFKTAPTLTVPTRPDGSIYFRYIVESDNAGKDMKALCKKGVQCRKPIFKPLHKYLNLDKKNYPNTERAYDKSISIPIFPSLRENEITCIIDETMKCSC